MIHKIIITGPVGSGKTTAVNSLGGDKAITTDAKASDKATKRRKKQTTVAMDYAVVKGSNGEMVHLYGTPGQDRFDFMWDILCKGAHGLILLLDNCRNYPKRDLKHYTQMFADVIDHTKLTVGVTRFDVSKKHNLDDYRHWLSEMNIDAEVFAIDARQKKDVQRLVDSLISPIDAVHLDSAHQKNTSPEETASPEPSDTEYNVSESTFQSILELKGVTEAAYANALGEPIHTNLNDEDMGEFIAFLSGVTPIIEENMQLGDIQKIMLRSPRNDNISVFIEQGSSLGVLSDRKLSVSALSQQVEDILQWDE